VLPRILVIPHLGSRGNRGLACHLSLFNFRFPQCGSFLELLNSRGGSFRCNAFIIPTSYTPISNGSAALQLGPNFWSVGPNQHRHDFIRGKALRSMLRRSGVNSGHQHLPTNARFHRRKRIETKRTPSPGGDGGRVWLTVG